jgi:hypothetical protein
MKGMGLTNWAGQTDRSLTVQRGIARLHRACQMRKEFKQEVDRTLKGRERLQRTI